ncbi:cysteine hydrolase family protein [Pseudovibrio brasiliensis]|uniref:Cysteine hydrolase n=1 Tax=Pseudovibrio brasiliensis TaxID=1898042 RepID=A0ABX8AHM8_9HYPH|nr:cysteine hydrolase [Pseudovibrio brasiliensis]QUS54575.1 cysteine hydrolase [Pseudovibrio brasiliensis]
MSVWSAVGLVVLVLVVGLGYTVQRLVRLQGPTKGEIIDRSICDQTALLVIDVQEDFTKNTRKRRWPTGYVEERIGRINRLADEAQRRGEPVIAVRHIHKGVVVNFLAKLMMEGLGTNGSDGLGLDKRLTIHSDMDIVKHIGDTFSNWELDKALAARKVGTLKIVGLDGCHCVRSTALGALNRGYEVELVEDAVLSIDPKAWEGCRTELAEKGVWMVKPAELAEIH